MGSLLSHVRLIVAWIPRCCITPLLKPDFLTVECWVTLFLGVSGESLSCEFFKCHSRPKKWIREIRSRSRFALLRRFIASTYRNKETSLTMSAVNFHLNVRVFRSLIWLLSQAAFLCSLWQGHSCPAAVFCFRNGWGIIAVHSVNTLCIPITLWLGWKFSAST